MKELTKKQKLQFIDYALKKLKRKPKYSYLCWLFTDFLYENNIIDFFNISEKELSFFFPLFMKEIIKIRGGSGPNLLAWKNSDINVRIKFLNTLKQNII